MHSFSTSLAKQYGYKAAILLQYLAHSIDKKPKMHDDKRWCRINTRSLKTRCPYLKTSTIYETLQRLVERGVLRIEEHNRRNIDRTCWYAFEDKTVFQSAKPGKDRIYFSEEDAVRYGVIEAVLIQNLIHWITNNRKKNPHYAYHKLSATHLAAKVLPFSRDQINRALKNLVAKGVLLQKQSPGADRSFMYSLSDRVDLSNAIPNNHGDNPDTDSGNPSKHSGFSEMHDANPNNDMYLKDKVNRQSLEEGFERENYTQPPSAGDLSRTQISNSVSPFQSLSTHISGGAVDIGAKETAKEESQNIVNFPPPYDGLSYEQLKETNSALWESLESSSQDRLADIAFTYFNAFVSRFDADALWQLRSINSEQELLERLGPEIDAFTPNWNIRPPDILPTLKNFIKQWFVEGVFRAKSGNYFCHGLWPADNIGIGWYCLFQPLVEDRIKKEQKDILSERSKQFASPMKEKESEIAIGAAEKMKVLQSSLASRNTIGMFDGWRRLVHNVFEYHGGALKAAERFFDANPALSVAHLNQIIDEILELKETMPPCIERDDPGFYIKSANNLSFLLIHLDQIVVHLKCPDQIPALHFLTKGELFPTKHNSTNTHNEETEP